MIHPTIENFIISPGLPPRIKFKDKHKERIYTSTETQRYVGFLNWVASTTKLIGAAFDDKFDGFNKNTCFAAWMENGAPAKKLNNTA